MNVVTLEDALATGRGVERPFCCPVHGDSNASASVNVEKGLWVCYACHAHGEVKGFAPSAEDVQRMLGRLDHKELRYPEGWLALFDADWMDRGKSKILPPSYWHQRYGFDTAHAFRCGVHPFTGCATYPIRNAAGKVLGVVQRKRDDDEEPGPKYRYPANTSTSRTLFGLHRQPARRLDTLVLVEGASDVMSLETDRPVDTLVLGTYGAGLHAPQVVLISRLHPRRIVLGFDADDAGQAATDRAREQLAEYDTYAVDWSTLGAKDPGEVETASARWGLVREAA